MITVERIRHARRDFCDPRSRGARSRCLCDDVGASRQIHTVPRLNARIPNGDRDDSSLSPAPRRKRLFDVWYPCGVNFSAPSRCQCTGRLARLNLHHLAAPDLNRMDGKRKLDTDNIVAKAMQEEEGRKRLKKTFPPAQQGADTRSCIASLEVTANVSGVQRACTA